MEGEGCGGFREMVMFRKALLSIWGSKVSRNRVLEGLAQEKKVRG